MLPPSGTATRAAADPAPTGEPADVVDAAVAAEVGRGELRLALTRLMNAYGGGVYRFCVSMLAERSLADDVHQSVFVQAYEGLAQFRGQGSRRAWLFGIARDRCLDAIKSRRRSRWRFILTGDASESHAAAPFEVEHTTETDRRSGALADCQRALAPHVRVAVLMRYEQSLSYE